MNRIWPAAGGTRSKRPTPRLDRWRKELLLLRAKQRAFDEAEAAKQREIESRRAVSRAMARIEIERITRKAHKPRRF